MQTMNTMTHLLGVGCLGLATSVAFAQPAIDHISNAASYVLAPPASEPNDTPLPNSSIAQGSFFVVFGSGLASSAPSEWGRYPLPTSLAGTSVKVTVGGTSTNAILFYAGPSAPPFESQVNAVMPSGTPTGAGTVVVSYNGQSSASFPVTVAAVSAGTFSLNHAGTGPGAFFNVASDGSLTRNTLFHPAAPGQIVTLYATGLGPIADPSAEGKQPPQQVDVRASDLLVDFWVGNRQATLLFAGRSSYTAQDEIDFVVPSGLSGCYNSVAVYAGPPGGQIVSNFTSIAVDADGGPCADGDGVNMADLAPAISANGSASVGAISLLSNYLLLSLGGGVITLPWDNDTVNGETATFTTAQLKTTLGLTSAPSVNSCAVSPYVGLTPVPTDPVLNLISYLDAGSALSASGPSTAACSPKCDPSSVAKNVNGQGYGALVGGATIAQLLSGGGLPPFFLDSSDVVAPGTFTVTGPGGANVGAFSASLNVVAPLIWNQGILNNPIPRNQPMNITWSGGDPNGYVEITGIASTYTGSGEPSAATPGVLFQCIAPTSAGSFTVPTVVLAALPSTTGGAGSLYPTGYLMVGPASGGVKVNPSPSGLDAAYLFYHYVQGSNMVWQ
jgi:uncharacterized protein (TIGR03437 family)